MLEEIFKEDPDNIPDTWLFEDEEEIAYENSQPPEPFPVRGYDNDFWEPLLEDTLGGSNAVEIMAGIHVPKTALKTYECTTGAHTVCLSGQDDTDWKKDLEFLGVHQKEGPPVHTGSASTRSRRPEQNTPNSRGYHTLLSTGTPNRPPPTPSSRVHNQSSYMRTSRGESSTHTIPGFDHQPAPATPPPRETRALSEISDEEFDIPPLFDDISYEAEDVLDLNWDDTDGKPTVGKLYTTKHDCQIGLAIYAIKNRFHFRQTRTTRTSFVLSCHDMHCDWRILAK